MTVERIMTTDASCCLPTATLASVAQMMWEKDCGSVPVCDPDGGVVGMITDRDICMAAWTQGRALQDLLVKDAMARSVICCEPQDGLAMVEALLQAHQLRRLPVVDPHGRLVGIVSLGDIARATAESGRRHSSEGELTRTLAAVSRPRGQSSVESPARVRVQF